MRQKNVKENIEFQTSLKMAENFGHFEGQAMPAPYHPGLCWNCREPALLSLVEKGGQTRKRPSSLVPEIPGCVQVSYQAAK